MADSAVSREINAATQTNEQKRGGMMSTILFIENDTALVSTINELVRTHLHTVSLLLHADNEEQALSLCQEYTPQLIIFDSDILDDEHLYPVIDQLKEMLPDSILILLLNENDIVRLRTFLRQRNERFLLKPLDEHNFLDIISACLKEITTIADDRDLISRLTERMQRFRPQLENMLIHDIAVNAPAERILQNLSILGYTFCEGVIAAVPVTEPKTVKDQVSALFARWGYDVIRSDFFEYSLYLILAHPFFRYEDVKRLEKQIALLNSDTFFSVPAMSSGASSSCISVIRKQWKRSSSIASFLWKNACLNTTALSWTSRSSGAPASSSLIF